MNSQHWIRENMTNPVRFTPQEALPLISQQRLPDKIRIDTPIIYKVALIRLLTGTLDIKCNYSDNVIKQRTDYSHLSLSMNKKISANTIGRAILPYKLKDLNLYITKTQFRNQNYFKELFTEYSNYFLRKDENNQVIAFLHLYRILESIAYCFPLFWAAKAPDYVGTFNKLKNYFNEPKTGELLVFRRFIDDTIDKTLVDTPVVITINSKYPDWQNHYFDSLIKCIPDPIDIISQIYGSEITVKYHCIIDLTINLRNKYFHYLTGNGNFLTSENVPENNEFFGIVNEIIANWLSVIFFEILDFEMEELSI